MRRLCFIAAIALAALSALIVLTARQSVAQQPDDAAARGAEIYESMCSYCHDRVPPGTALPMLPGVASLALKYDGALSPYIKERPDLANVAVLATFLRNGSGSMPPFRKTEVTDDDISAIAAFFAQTSGER